MSEPRRIRAGEVSHDEILATLKAGERVIVLTEFLGSEYEVTLRWDGETFYCDTPTRLHKHETEDEMRACLEEQGYVQDLTE